MKFLKMQNAATTAVAIVTLLFSQCEGDINLHNPRGSNNKLNEQSNNVQNNRRLFDSQNNAGCGYQHGDRCIPNCLNGNQYDEDAPGAGEGVMEFYEGSELQIEWTNQHGSQNPRLHNNVVAQYMCDDGSSPYNAGIRDGKRRGRIPENQSNENLTEFGQHENYKFWDECRQRERNNGLYKADQNIKQEARAIHTRQDTNNNDDRYGFECPEERDYYPYWHPSPWRDVWVCTDTPVNCGIYKQESQNVIDKGLCSIHLYNNERECVNNAGTWTMSGNYNIPAPNCTVCQPTRNNHNGNIQGEDDSPNFTWKIPTGIHPDGANCVLRIRYNVTTKDFDDAFHTYADSNGANSPVKNNPVKDFVGYGPNITGPLRLAMDTSQFGRTFEDRSHVFKIRKRPDIKCGAFSGDSCVIKNLNVRGRRGNIAQTYPSVEYDFVPGVLNVRRNDYIHVQWTGADSNQQNNAGQGRAGTDRNNLVVMSNIGENVPKNLNPLDKEIDTTAWHFTTSKDAIARLAFGEQTECDPEEDDTQSNNNCKVLNRTPGYVNHGLIQAENVGVFAIMSTRNNAFSNREQKAYIVVEEDVVIVATAAAGTFVGVGLICAAAFGFTRVKKKRDVKISKSQDNLASDMELNATSSDALNSNVEHAGPPSFRTRIALSIIEWYEWNKARLLFWSFFIFTLVAFGSWGYLSNMHVTAPPYFVYAKVFGKLLDFLLSFLVIPVLRNFLSFLRTTPAGERFPLDDNLLIHTYTGILVAICAAGHIFFHYWDFIWLESHKAQPIWWNAFANLPGSTGHVVTVLMLLIFASAKLKRRIRKVFGVRFDGYAVFLKIHRLWVPIYLLLFLHSETFWKFCLFPILFLLLEKFIQAKRVKQNVRIVGAKMAGRDVLGLKMRLTNSRKKFHYKAGQYLFLCCPDINEKEYHPFTITSAPEDDYFSCHIRCRNDMDWTFALRQRLGFADTVDDNGNKVPARNVAITMENIHELDVPTLRVDGPYGSASEEVFDYKTVVLVGAGIGVTPFVSILKSISARITSISDIQIHFYWICRDQNEFDNFKEFLDETLRIPELGRRLELNLYVTGEMNLRNIRSDMEMYNQYSGRPNWNRIFKEMTKIYRGQEIGVFLCGPDAIASQLIVACKTHSASRIKTTKKDRKLSNDVPSDKTIFTFHKENF